jgi:hypothetical protein
VLSVISEYRHSSQYQGGTLHLTANKSLNWNHIELDKDVGKAIKYSFTFCAVEDAG